MRCALRNPKCSFASVKTSVTPLAGNWFTRSGYLLIVPERSRKLGVGRIDFTNAPILGRVYRREPTHWTFHNSDPERTFHYFLCSTPGTMRPLQNEINARSPFVQSIGCKSLSSRKSGESGLDACDFTTQTLPRGPLPVAKRYFGGNPQFIRSMIKNRP